MVGSIKKTLSSVRFFSKKIILLAWQIKYLDSIGMLINNKLCLRWAGDPVNKHNFGDALSPILLKRITGRESVCSGNVINFLQKPVICFIGSILDNLNRNNAIICGAGFQKEDAVIKVKPSLVIAVRGPLSREILIKNKVKCPELYGDPAILLPMFYEKPVPEKKWDVGIIAHYVDKDVLNRLSIISSGYSYKIIDIESPIEDVIDNIVNSRFVFSSSLHGVIVAHSYEVPATWIKLSESVIGGDFKFRDYALSANSKSLSCYEVNECIDLKRGIELSVLFDLKEIRDKLNNAMVEYFGVNVGS